MIARSRRTLWCHLGPSAPALGAAGAENRSVYRKKFRKISPRAVPGSDPRSRRHRIAPAGCPPFSAFDSRLLSPPTVPGRRAGALGRQPDRSIGRVYRFFTHSRANQCLAPPINDCAESSCAFWCKNHPASPTRSRVMPEKVQPSKGIWHPLRPSETIYMNMCLDVHALPKVRRGTRQVAS